MNINDKIWIIKSSGRLIGPLFISEVVIHLQQQSLSVIDEIRSPYERWRFIREKEVVMALLKQMGGVRGNNSQSETTNVVEKTQTKTEAVDDNHTDEFLISKESARAANQAYQKLISAKEKEIPPTQLAESGRRTYATSFDPRIQERLAAKRKSQKYIFLGAIALFIIVVTLAFSYGIKKQKDRITYYSKSMNRAREKIQVGQYPEALETYEKVYTFNRELFSDQDVINYTLLLVRVASRFGSAETVISSIQKPENLVNRRQWMMAKLKISLSKEAWQEARLILHELKQALPNDPEIKLAIVKSELLSGRLEQAFFALEQNINLFKESRKHLDQASILMGKIALVSPKVSYRALAFSRALELLQVSAVGFEPNYFYKKILLIALQAELSSELAKKSVDDLWSVNIYDLNDFVINLTSIRKATDPNALLSICVDVSKTISVFADGLGDNLKYADYATSIEAICRYYAGARSEAYKTISLARKQRPSSAILASVEANLLVRDERIAEASARISLCGNLPHCRLARLKECFIREDDSCLTSLLNQTHYKWVGPYYNLVSAEVAKKRGNDFSHKDQIIKGLQSFPEYQPLIVRRP